MTNETSAEPYDYAIHSDFLIHWTGKDIDGKDDWAKNPSSKTEGDITDQYLKRLRDILKYGLWMTEETQSFCKNCIKQCNIGAINHPSVKTCFTELKISESRKHAREYGRLGIGIKRRFLFERLGRPVVYCQNYHHHGEQYCDELLKSCACACTYNKSMLDFFKPMGEENLSFNYFFESEWRIVFSEKLLKQNGKGIIDPYIAAQNENNDLKISGDVNKHLKYNEYLKYLGDAKSKLKYLIPLDGQLSMIIYPSLDVKNMAQKWMKGKNQGIGQEIYEAIKQIKKAPEQGEHFEGGNWPIELDLDACRNF